MLGVSFGWCPLRTACAVGWAPIPVMSSATGLSHLRRCRRQPSKGQALQSQVSRSSAATGANSGGSFGSTAAAGGSFADALLSAFVGLEQQKADVTDQRNPDAIMHLQRLLSINRRTWLVQGVTAAEAPNSPSSVEVSASQTDGAFCTNCCVPMTAEAKACSFCEHQKSDDYALLGTHSVWLKHRDSNSSAAPLAGTDLEAGAAVIQDVGGRQQQQQPPPPPEAIKASPYGAGSGTRVAIGFDERMMLHTGALWPYPERPERLQAIMTRLHNAGLIGLCDKLTSRAATDAELEAVHSRRLIEALEATSQSDAMQSATIFSVADKLPPVAHSKTVAGVLACIAPDTLCNVHTNSAARLAAGVAVEAAQAVASGRAAAALAIVRPPGHQATRDLAQGGCFFNSVAVATRAAQAAGAERVMIVDWGVHHAQGTQSIFQDDGSVLFVSLHRHDEGFYPETGEPTDVGGTEDEEAAEGGGDDGARGSAAGFTMNIAWPQNMINDTDCIQALLHVVLPAAYDFDPDMVIISAGFDAASDDFVGGCRVTPEGYAHMTHILRSVAPVTMVLEGGYNLDTTSRCVEACLRVLMGERPGRLTGKWQGTSGGWGGILNGMQIQGKFWKEVEPLSFDGWSRLVGEQRRREQLRQEAGGQSITGGRDYGVELDEQGALSQYAGNEEDNGDEEKN